MCQPDTSATSELTLVVCAKWVYTLIVKSKKESVPVRVARGAFCLLRDSCRKLSSVLRSYPDPHYPLTGYEIPFLLSATLALACVVFLLSMGLDVFLQNTQVRVGRVFTVR